MKITVLGQGGMGRLFGRVNAKSDAEIGFVGRDWLAVAPNNDRPSLLHDINLSQLESRPNRQHFSRYNFYMNMDVQATDARVNRLFEQWKLTK